MHYVVGEREPCRDSEVFGMQRYEPIERVIYAITEQFSLFSEVLVGIIILNTGQTTTVKNEEG